MRSTLILLSMVFLSALGFGVYWMMQSPIRPLVNNVPQKQAATYSTTLPTTSPTMLGAVNGVWWDRYSPKTGERTSRIRADRYEPQANGRVKVIRPEAEFFLDKGRVLRLVGKQGFLTMQESVGRNSKLTGFNGVSQTPRSGDLKSVTLLMLDSTQATHPTLTMTMNNASFDNETFRIATEAYENEAGKVIPGDQVPVTIRGDDYEFDGRGLRLQYNEVDHRLENLRIEHGQRLLMKNARGFTDMGAAPAPAAAAKPAAGGSATLTPPVKANAPAAAAGTPVKPAEKIVVAPTTQGSGAQPLYRATFKQAVEVFQAGQRLAKADELQVDFFAEQNDVTGGIVGDGPVTAENTATNKTTLDNSVAAKPLTDMAKPAGQAKPNVQGTTAAPGAAATQPTTKPIVQPIEVQWTGPLTVVPLLGDPPERMAPGEYIVHMSATTGRAVEISRQNELVRDELRCAALTYWTIDKGVLLEEAAGVPVEMSDSRGRVINTHRMVVNRQQGTALLSGKSHARLPLPTTAPSAANPKPVIPTMQAQWTDRCLLYFQPGRGDDMVIKHADLLGNVVVDHPKLTMKAQSLDMVFEDAPAIAANANQAEASGATPPLRQLDAKGDVHCAVNGPGGTDDKRRIDCQNLTLLTAHGADNELYARNIVAIGQVHAIDDKRDLTAGYLSVTMLQPTTRPANAPPLAKGDIPSGDLQSMIAHDKVHVVTAKGEKADADELIIQTHDAPGQPAARQTTVTLHGKPARVTREKDSLAGDIIRMIPETEQLTVTGEGELIGTKKAAAGKVANPVNITWKRGLDAHDNIVECTGEVVASTIDADGSRKTAKGDRVVLYTTTRPTTQPAATGVAVATAAPAAPQSTTRPSGELGVMGNRDIQSIILDGHAQTTSELYGPDGQLLRLSHVTSETIQFFQDDPKASRLVIPKAGQMLAVDNRPPSTQPAAREAAADPMGMRGKTLFAWQKSLVYDERAQQVEMTGEVLVRRIDQTEKTDLRLWADRVIAEIEPTPQSATQPAGGGLDTADLGSRMQVRKVRAEGSAAQPLQITSKTLNITAVTMEYNPATHVLIARGDGRTRVRQLDQREMETASFDEFIYNTVTEKFTSKNPILNSRK